MWVFENSLYFLLNLSVNLNLKRERDPEGLSGWDGLQEVGGERRSVEASRSGAERVSMASLHLPRASGEQGGCLPLSPG